MKAAERQKDHQRLFNNPKLIQRNYTVAELSELLGISKPTWMARMKEPWCKFSYDDFVLISQYCKVDFTTLICGELKNR